MSGTNWTVNINNDFYLMEKKINVEIYLNDKAFTSY